jgi:N6-adenosine-specific RNA methylase IME4
MNNTSKSFQNIVCDPPWGFSDSLSMSDVKRGAAANYPTMKLPHIQALPVQDVADPDGCLLALWVPSSMLQDGLDTMKLWGFEQKQTYIWCKTIKNPWKDIDHWIKVHWANQWKNNPFKSIKDIKLVSELCAMVLAAKVPLTSLLSFGLGRIFRQSHEICLIGINNTKIYQRLANKSQRSVSFAPNLKHSSKPECLQDSLELMFPDQPDHPINRLELFARRERPGWTCLGNECPATMGQDIRDSMAQLIADIGPINVYAGAPVSSEENAAAQ